MDVQIQIPPTVASRRATLSHIEDRLVERGQTLTHAIAERELYFRVSVVGTCNLSCTFCHNEGAPVRGKLSVEVAETAIKAAVAEGFTRVQFTGGEPLLRPDIDEFVRRARSYVVDVGITTNGTYLPVRLAGLMAAGIHRIHVSLQTESLEEAGSVDVWGIPEWLMPTAELAAEGAFSVRFNLPVPADALGTAEAFLRVLTARGIDVKVFSVLPEGDVREDAYPLGELGAIVERVNQHNVAARTESPGTVFMRGFRPPAGIRCSTCIDLPRCKEQSHSLRLGSDLRLRPCLATRRWDSDLDIANVDTSIREAALLALDYAW